MIEALKMDDSGIEQKRGNQVASFDTLEYEDVSSKLQQERDDQKIEQGRQATKLKILLSLEKFGIKEEDFELVNKDGTFVVISNSSYFSSIVGLNGIQEKENGRSTKDRSKYDGFDKQLNDSLKSGISKDDAQKQLKKYCKENNLDFESMITGGGSIISEGDYQFVGIKKIVGDSGDIIEKNR